MTDQAKEKKPHPKPVLMPEERIAYTIAEAAVACGLSDDTLYRKHNAGEITMRKVGRRTLIAAVDLQHLIDAAPALPRRAA